MRLKSFGEGRAEVSFAPEEYHVNFVGAVHGGVISAVLDSCIGYAVNTTLGRDEAFVTSQLNVQFVRGIRIGTESLVARAACATAEGAWSWPKHRSKMPRAPLCDGDRDLLDPRPAIDVMSAG